MDTNCQNCGGTLSLEEYQDRLTCEYCGTLHVPSLIEAGLISIAPGVTSTLSCPDCSEFLTPAQVDNSRLFACRQCRGLLVSSRNLLKIILYCRSRTESPPREPEPIAPHELARRVNCPECDEVMKAHPYYGPGHFIIDTCVSCRRVWLDGGELTKAATHKWGGSLWL